jgi:hypothetical protein
LSIFSNQIRNHDSIKIFEDAKNPVILFLLDDVVDATIAGIEMTMPMEKFSMSELVLLLM